MRLCGMRESKEILMVVGKGLEYPDTKVSVPNGQKDVLPSERAHSIQD